MKLYQCINEEIEEILVDESYYIEPKIDCYYDFVYSQRKKKTRRAQSSNGKFCVEWYVYRDATQIIITRYQCVIPIEHRHFYHIDPNFITEIRSLLREVNSW